MKTECKNSFSGHASRNTDIFLLKNSSCSRQSRSQVSARHARSTSFCALTLAVMFFILPLAAFAQGEAIFTKQQYEATKERINDIVARLVAVGTKIDALPEAAPTSLATFFPLTDAGGYPRTSFGVLESFDSSRDATISLKNPSGRPATFFGVRGLSSPFSFKGGAYPGIGGTCGQTIPAGVCTLVLQYTPRAADTGTKMGEIIRHTAVLFLDAIPGGADLEEPSNPFGLTGYVQGGTADTISTEALTSTLLNKPSDVFPGEISSFVVKVGLRDSADIRAVFFDKVTVNDIAPPFVLEKNECAEQPINTAGCIIRFQFRPQTSGIFRDNFSISLHIGGDMYKQFPVSVSGRALLSTDTLDVNQQVLLMYNNAWAEGRVVFDYYRAHRPGFASANILEINLPVSPRCSTDVCRAEALEVISYPDIRDRVIAPLLSWLRQHQTKNIQYIALVGALPSRTTDADIAAYEQESGVQEMIRREVAREFAREVFVSSVYMGSLDATKSYIDKLEKVYQLMPTKSALISARNTDMAGTTYYFSDAYAPDFEGISTSAKEFADALKSTRPAAPIVHKGFKDSVLTSLSDVAGFFHRGIYGYNYNRRYATDGTIRLTGRSNWYLTETVESFKGQWLANKEVGELADARVPGIVHGTMGNFVEWFSANAYGGTNYSATPAAAVTHVLEPGGNGANGPSLFTCWDMGRPFAYCAWKSDRSGGRLQAVGDPLVTR